MNTALLAAAMVLVVNAHAALPLPGYAARTPSVPASDPFPSSTRLYGGAQDPLEALAVDGEELRDAVASVPSASTLQAGLRAPRIDDRLVAVRAAAQPREVASIPYLAAALLRLDEPARLRAAAALALGRIGDRVAVPALAEGLKDPMPEVRYAVALSLGRLPADGVATRLERVLRTDPAWQVRYAAVIALGRTRKGFAATALAEALTSDGSWQVRQQAARSLQDLSSPQASAALVGALFDPEPSVRAAAGTALAESDVPSLRSALDDALADEKDPSVRAVLSAATRRAIKRP